MNKKLESFIAWSIIIIFSVGVVFITVTAVENGIEKYNRYEKEKLDHNYYSCVVELEEIREERKSCVEFCQEIENFK